MIPIEISSRSQPQPQLVSLGEYRITYYCSCRRCCGKWADLRGDKPVVGAHGRELVSMYSCASPLTDGTELYIEGIGDLRVDDKTAKFIVDRYDGKIIDIYVNSHDQIPSNRKDYMEVFVYE